VFVPEDRSDHSSGHKTGDRRDDPEEKNYCGSRRASGSQQEQNERDDRRQQSEKYRRGHGSEFEFSSFRQIGLGDVLHIKSIND
jgi:hypothetical protein